jgi:hypothetical protein
MTPANRFPARNFDAKTFDVGAYGAIVAVGRRGGSDGHVMPRAKEFVGETVDHLG